MVAGQSPVAGGLADGRQAVRPLYLQHNIGAAAAVAACGAI